VTTLAIPDPPPRPNRRSRSIFDATPEVTAELQDLIWWLTGRIQETAGTDRVYRARNRVNQSLQELLTTHKRADLADSLADVLDFLKNCRPGDRIDTTLIMARDQVVRIAYSAKAEVTL